MKTRKSMFRWLVVGGVWAASAACLSPPVESPTTKVVQQTPIRVPQNEQNQVDILFMVDNSPSMLAMQTELKNKFGQFLAVFDQLAMKGTFADLHIGVVTSDYGAGAVSNLVNGGCDSSPGGQKGLLQQVGAAGAGCMGPQGSPYIQYAYQATGGAKGNLPGGVNDSPTLLKTFTCMASVGAGGCGFEHQLESVYAALKNTKENAGFLRDGALLAVVFVTNEDDGSAPSNSDIFNPDPTKATPMMYGAYDTYRQTRFGVACGNPLALTPYGDSMGMLTACQAAPNNMVQQLGSEFDVQRYIDLFTKSTGQGGVVADPYNNVILVGIDAPESPFSIIVADHNSGQGTQPNPGYVTCSPINPPSCIPRLQHSCQNMVQPGFFGDPAIRLNTVIRTARYHNISSICGANPAASPDYSTALQDLANLISSAISPGCIPSPLTNLTNPDCVVEDVTTNPDGSVTEKQLSACTVDPNTNMPTTTTAVPCWYVHPNDKCVGISPQGVGITVYRAGQPAPLNTTARVECSTVAGTGAGDMAH